MVQHSILIIICLLLVLGAHGILAFKWGTSSRFLREHITRSSAPYPDSAAHSLLKIHSTNSNTVTTPSSKITLKASSFSGESANQNLSPFDSNNEKTPTPWTIPPTTTIIKRFVAASTIISLLALGLQQPAYANALDILQEKAKSSGFLQSFLLIFVSEIGDKTFFIAGLLAAKYSRLISFTGSIGALGVMTVISTLLGQIFNAIPEGLTQGVPFADYVAVAAFSYFGLKTLYDASQLDEGDNSGIEEEKEDAEETVSKLTEEERRENALSRIVQTFTVVFAAEIGDRSFLSTIALSAANNPVAVATGAIVAHASATGIAVLGGALLSKYLSEKVIGYIGGSLFVVFAITTALGVF